MSDQYDGYDGYDGYEEYEDYEDFDDDFRPDGMPGQMMPSQGQPGQMMPPQGQPPFGPPQGQPPFGPPQGQPPFGPPQGQPPFGPPGQPALMPYSPGPHNFGQFAPNMRPPSFIPRRPGFFPGPIRRCRNRFAFIWLRNGRSFWAWISSVTDRVVYGYRWNGRRWVYFEVFVNNIITFVCIR